MLQPVTRPVSRGGLRQAPGFFRQAWLVFRKDVAIELRSGELSTTSVFFATLVVILASVSFHGGPTTGRLVMSGVIWLSVLFAAVLSLTKGWAREREGQALAGLLSTPLAPGALFLGKVVWLMAFLWLLELVVIPLAALFFSVDLLSIAPGLFLLALATTPGIAAAGTLFGSMSVRTAARDLAISIVLFPLLSPVVLTAVSATRSLLDGASVGELGGYFRLLLVFDFTFLSAGIALFGSLIED